MNPIDLRGALERAAEGFLLLEPTSSDRAVFAFTGSLEGVERLWRCELLAVREGPSYIEIGPDAGEITPLRVALPLARVDRASILKTIIMIRNYKRLRRGRHEFGL